MNMASSTQFAPTRRMGVCDPVHQMSMWEDAFRSHISPNTGVCIISEGEERLNEKSEYTSQEPLMASLDTQAARRSIPDKVGRRLAQNREAARKSRLRKKAYVQQLETSRLKLAQLELELDKARLQGLCINPAPNVGLSGSINPGIVAFEMEYGHWLEEQKRKTSELGTALQTPISDMELRLLVDNFLNHYIDLFRMKADAAKADVFYLVSGVWRTSVERFFLWIGGFRPSELVNILIPTIQPLTDQQLVDVGNLRQSCQQAEDALTQGIDKLQQNIVQRIATYPIGMGSYCPQMASAVEILEALESFINQADHLRQQTLQRMTFILTTRQAARGLLAFGVYFQRLRNLSSLWATRPRDLH